MKKMRLLPSAVLAANLLLAAVFLLSCESENSNNVKTDNGYTITVIDSCEYIYKYNGYNRGYMFSHKGNCKFCADRQHSR